MATEQNAMTPAEAKALKIWDQLPVSERNYAEVAKRYIKSNGEPITEGRAGVYMREALEKSGRLDEAPTRGRRSNATATAPQPDALKGSFWKAIEQMVASYDAQIESLTERLNEAKSEAAEFDPERFIEAEANRMRQDIIERTARLNAWESNEGEVATSEANAHATTLNERAERLEREVTEQIEALASERDVAQNTLAAHAEQA